MPGFQKAVYTERPGTGIVFGCLLMLAGIGIAALLGVVVWAGLELWSRLVYL